MSAAAKEFSYRPIKPGRLTCGLLGFARERVLRHETVDGYSIALLPRSGAPDLYLRRGELVTETHLQSLRAQYLLTYNGVFTFTDDHGGEYLAVPVAQITKVAA